MKKLLTLCAALIFTALSFAQTQRLVLFEEFTGENCPPCASINPYVDALAAQNPNEVILMHYIAPIPTPGILSAQVNAVVGGRMSYYGVNSTPWGQQDGAMWDSTLIASYGNNPSTWCLNLSTGALNPAYLNNEYGVPAPFTITITDTLTGVTDSFYATVTITAAEAFTATNTFKLQMAMVENLQFSSPPGNNGETSWSNAVRAMYPSYLGTTVPTTWTNGQVKTYTFKGKMPAFIRDKSQVRFVAFLQDAGNKHVEQAGISNFFTLKLDIGTTGIQGNFANCNSAQYTPVISLTNVGSQTISSCFISEYVDNIFIDSVPWTGSLATGNVTNATLAPLTIATGVHKLTLKLTGPNHAADMNPGNDSVSITLNMPVPEASTPLIEGFETGNPNLNGWAVESPDHDSTWRVVAPGNASAHSYMVDFYDDLYNDFVGPTDNLYAPPLNLTYAAHATVKFSFANQWVNFGNNQYGLDSLDIDVSTDCGNTWTTVYATNVATAPAQSVNTAVPFVPTALQWKSDSANISIAANHHDVLLRFRPQTFDGNNLYLDNINIYKYDSVAYTDIVTTNGILSVSVYPNPSNDQVNISLQLLNDAQVSYHVTDLTGKTIANIPAEAKNTGQNMISINTSHWAEGVYFVTIFAGNNKASKIISVMH